MAGETAADFKNNRSRMHYPRWCAAGVSVGSGVIEGAYRSLVCERLKKSGMFWSVKGADKIFALRGRIPRLGRLLGILGGGEKSGLKKKYGSHPYY